MQTLSCFFLITFLVACRGENSNAKNDMLKTQQADQTNFHGNISVQNLQGDWTTFGIVSRRGCNGPITEESVADFAEIRSWSFDGDSVHIFRYPCQFFGSKIFRVSNDSLYLDGNKFAFAHIRFMNSIMVLTAPNCETRNFFRDTLDPEIVNILIRDSVNMECLVGKMKLVTKSFIKGDDGPVVLTWPVAMPSIINIPDKEFARKIHKTKTIMLDVGSEKKLFKVTAIAWDNFGDNFASAVNNDGKKKTVLTLSPAEWWKGEEFTVSYQEE